MIEPPDLGALIRKVLPRQANHFSAAAEHDIQLDQQQGETTSTASNNTTTKAA
jgi:hypothetical protein